MELDQKHQLAGTLATLYSNSRPEAQADIAQRMLQIYSTPIGKKLPKDIADVSTLGQKQMQAGMQQAGQAGAAQQVQSQGAAFPAQQQTMTPPPDAGGAPGTAAAPTGGPSPMALGGAPHIPPPPDLSQPSSGYSPLYSADEKNTLEANRLTATETAKTGAELGARKQYADSMGLTGRDRENFIAGRMVTPYAHQQQKNYVDPDNPGQPLAGNYDPLTGVVTDMQGNVIDNPQPWVTAVASPATPFRATLQANRSQGISDQQTLNDWNTRNSQIKGIRMVAQPDGTIVAVPVTTTNTTQTHGMLPTPPGEAAAPKKAGGGGAGAASTGKVVGGKIPHEVSVAQTQYQDSVSRYNVMADALPKALAGDQQAMINLLYNHIGMTTGLQKGARITQDIIDEAQHSAPWMGTLLARIGVGNGFEMTPELMRGVVLQPQQMHQMVDLAENRLGQDYRKFTDTKSYYDNGGSKLPAPPDQVASDAKARNTKGGGGPPPPPKSGGTVMMVAPNGMKKAVPADQVDHYKSLGAKVIQ